MASSVPLLLVISFDGFRYDYLKKTETPNFDKFKLEGSTVPFLNPVFPTKTCINFQSISTGLYPENHGVVDNVIYDDKLNKTFDWKNEELYHWNESVIPIWTLNEMSGNGRKSGLLSWMGGLAAYGPNKMRPFKVTEFNEQRPFTWRIDTALGWLTDPNEPCNFVMVYIEEPDEISHKFGPDSPEVVKMIQKLDTVIGYLFDRMEELQLTSKVDVIFLSDHGHQAVDAHPDTKINFEKFLNESHYIRVGDDISPVLQIKAKSPEFLGQIAEGLEKARNEYKKTFKYYKKQDIPERWHIAKAEGRIHDFLLLADSGYAFSPNASEYKTEIGDHGYDNTDPLMRASFIAKGPNLKKGFIGSPIINLDLFPLMCKLLGINEPKNDGHLENVKQFLTKTSKNQIFNIERTKKIFNSSEKKNTKKPKALSIKS